MIKIKFTKSFKKDYKKFKHNKIVLEKLNYVIKALKDGKYLEIEYKDHALIGDKIGFRECHLIWDVLLMYKVDKFSKTISLKNIGSHSELL